MRRAPRWTPCAAYGASIIAHDDRATLFDRLREEQARSGAAFVHPFDDPAGLAGAGTVGWSSSNSPPTSTSWWCRSAWRAHGGRARARVKALRPACRVIGVELAEARA